MGQVNAIKGLRTDISRLPFERQWEINSANANNVICPSTTSLPKLI